jgi:glucose uptake protein
MIIPVTYSAALLLTILSMLCWGSWANTFKLSGKWRFELFYFDYSLGVLVAAIIAALTWGTMGDELSFRDNLSIASRTNMGYAFIAGVIFNLANMLLVAAISVAGLAVAFPVGIGLALVVGVIWNYILNPQGNLILLALGVTLVVIAIIVDALAYRAHEASKTLLQATVGAPSGSARSTSRPVRNPRVGPAERARQSRKGGLKGILLSLLSGILMGSFYPLVEVSKTGDLGLGPYSVAVIFGVGVFLSTFVFNIYFMNLPVEGEPVALYQYFSGTARQHLLGLAGGMIWCTGAIANFVAASAPKSVQVGPAISYAIGQGATMVSALWGLLVWHEFKGATPRVRTLLAVMLLCFVAGLALLSIAPLFVQ